MSDTSLSLLSICPYFLIFLSLLPTVLIPSAHPSFLTSSGCFPKGSGQYSSGGSSLHQRGGEASLLRELPAGLHQQLPGHASGCPGNTVHLISQAFSEQKDEENHPKQKHSVLLIPLFRCFSLEFRCSFGVKDDEAPKQQASPAKSYVCVCVCVCVCKCVCRITQSTACST